MDSRFKLPCGAPCGQHRARKTCLFQPRSRQIVFPWSSPREAATQMYFGTLLPPVLSPASQTPLDPLAMSCATMDSLVLRCIRFATFDSAHIKQEKIGERKLCAREYPCHVARIPQSKKALKRWQRQHRSSAAKKAAAHTVENPALHRQLHFFLAGTLLRRFVHLDLTNRIASVGEARSHMPIPPPLGRRHPRGNAVEVVF